MKFDDVSGSYRKTCLYAIKRDDAGPTAAIRRRREVILKWRWTLGDVMGTKPADRMRVKQRKQSQQKYLNKECHERTSATALSSTKSPMRSKEVMQAAHVYATDFMTVAFWNAFYREGRGGYDEWWWWVRNPECVYSVIVTNCHCHSSRKESESIRCRDVTNSWKCDSFDWQWLGSEPN